MLSVKAFDSRNGDALMVEAAADGMCWTALIDGGVGRTFVDRVRPYLHSLRPTLPDAAQPLILDLVSCTHIDSDHIAGLLDLVEEAEPAGSNATWWPLQFWHNTFDDLAADLAPDHLFVIAGVGQGRDLRDALIRKGIVVNGPAGGMAEAPKVLTGDVVHLDLLCPDHAAIEVLREFWRKELERLGRLTVEASTPDDSPSNLSSLVHHIAGPNDRRLLLTGDQVAHSIIDGLRDGGFGHLAAPHHVDLLQVPHHGSRRNSSVELYQRVTADHYLVSAKGGADKPHPDVANMIAEARAGAAFEVWLTNESPAFTTALLNSASRYGCRVLIHVRDPQQPFIALTFD